MSGLLVAVALWSAISFVFLVLGIAVIFPARGEYRDARDEVDAALRVDSIGTMVLVEAELSVRYYIFLAQVSGAVVMSMFFLIGITILLLPQPIAIGVPIARAIPWFMVLAEIMDGLVQTFLLIGTISVRRSRQRWREIREAAGSDVSDAKK
jgi:hypothetical protein